MSKKPAGPAWPASAVEMVDLDKLIPYARNSRTHSPEQVAQIAASIREWGWTVPVLIDEAGMIIAGHGRVLAAQKLGIDNIPAMTAAGWTESQKRAYVIADNKLALNAEWDEELLATELSELKDSDISEFLTGFDENEIGSILGLDEDNSPPLQDETKFILMLEFSTERELMREFERAQNEGIKCKIIE